MIICFYEGGYSENYLNNADLWNITVPGALAGFPVTNLVDGLTTTAFISDSHGSLPFIEIKLPGNYLVGKVKLELVTYQAGVNLEVIYKKKKVFKGLFSKSFKKKFLLIDT